MKNTYDLAVVFDDILTHFDTASQELLRLHQRLAPRLLRIDLAFLPPATLICRLGFDPSFVSSSKIADRLSVAQARHFRVLDLMSISAGGEHDLFDQQAATAPWRRCPSTALAGDLAALRTALADRIEQAERREAGRSSVAAAVRFTGCPEEGVGLAKELTTRGMFVESDTLPEPGMNLVLHLEPMRSTELRDLPAKVVHVLSHDAARQSSRVPGFGVAFRLAGRRKQLFDSYLVSAIRGLPWPERSGRRYDRFPIDLRARWDAGETSFESRTINISRGGVRILGHDDQAPGTEGTLTLFGPLDDRHEVLRARVTHTHHATPGANGEPSDLQPRGLGLELLDPEDVVAQQLARVLGAGPLPPVHRALIVDDDLFFARLLGAALRRCGYEVRHAKSAEWAMKQLMEELFRFDAVVVDLHLPGITGKAFIEWLSNVDGGNDMVVFLVSALGLSGDEQQRLLALGAKEILAKDIDAEKMAAMVDARVARERAAGPVTP